MIEARQPRRVVPPRRRRTGWPYEDGDPHSGELTARSWPCGHIEGGFAYGPLDECRAGDVLVEDYVSPPHVYARLRRESEGRMVVVESTHERTTVRAVLDDDLVVFYDVYHHPGGLR